jgi:uncharacterized ferritin-like protein (DUF455 family)
MEFFTELKNILEISSYEEKIESSKFFFELFYNDKLSFNHNFSIQNFSPSYSFCEIVPPKKVPRRRGFETDEKKAVLIHAIVHIEYSAIDLAFDAAYRFRNMPYQFYKDWIEVAEDEVRHFEILNSLLNKLGYKYGDFAVHNSLYEASQKTPKLIDRMAIVPRWLEANGLDANENIIKKLQNYKNDSIAKKLIDALNIILIEEIPHVKKGDYWFKWVCEKEGLNPEDKYFEIINRIYDNVKAKAYINIEARKKAGFSCNEIKRLAKDEINC